MKAIVVTLFALIMLMSISVYCTTNEGNVQTDDTVDSTAVVTVDNQMAEQYIVSYLHMNRRCVTCERLEAYSEEAIFSGFAEQLKDSSLVWRSLNFEVKGNEHFAKKYQLYSQSGTSKEPIQCRRR